MKFQKDKYLSEMKGMVDKAIDRISIEKKYFKIYSFNIWTDPSAAVSSISIDSKTNSDAKVRKSDKWNKKYYNRYTAQGDVKMAKLFGPVTRNRNPADFELRDFEELSNASIPENWEEGTDGKCWDILEPALKEIGEYAFARLRTEQIDLEFELSVNGRHDWYEFTWNLK